MTVQNGSPSFATDLASNQCHIGQHSLVISTKTGHNGRHAEVSIRCDLSWKRMFGVVTTGVPLFFCHCTSFNFDAQYCARRFVSLVELRCSKAVATSFPSQNTLRERGAYSTSSPQSTSLEDVRILCLCMFGDGRSHHATKTNVGD